MRTIIIQAGNSDNRLLQSEWSEYIRDVDAALADVGAAIHFRGFSPSDVPWQNACWVAELVPDAAQLLRARLWTVRSHWRQGSIAWTEGETCFV